MRLVSAIYLLPDPLPGLNLSENLIGQLPLDDLPSSVPVDFGITLHYRVFPAIECAAFGS